MVKTLENDKRNILASKYDSQQKMIKLIKNELQKYMHTYIQIQYSSFMLALLMYLVMLYLTRYFQIKQKNQHKLNPLLFQQSLKQKKTLSYNQIIERQRNKISKQQKAKQRMNQMLKKKQLTHQIQPKYQHSNTQSTINQTRLIKESSRDCLHLSQKLIISEENSSQIQSYQFQHSNVLKENSCKFQVIRKQACMLASKSQIISNDLQPTAFCQSDQNRGIYQIQDQSTKFGPNLSILAEKKQSFTVADYAKCSGLIKSVWYNRYGQVEVVAYATAFAISPRIIVSCAHGIYDKKRDRPCDKIYFVPSHCQKGYIRKEDIYESIDHDFLKYDPLKQNQKYGSKPIQKDLAVFIINRPFINNCYLKLCDEQISKNAPLKIWGYPSKEIPPLANLQGMKLKRVDLNGNFVQKSDNYILVHNMHTQGGHSGSPIVCVTDKYNNESIKVVGIHTHKGTNDTNQGLIMTHKMKKKILKFAKELSHQHFVNFESHSKVNSIKPNQKVVLKRDKWCNSYSNSNSYASLFIHKQSY